jgi:hypothetical protein
MVLSSENRRSIRKVENLISPNAKRFQDMGSKRVDQRNIRRVPAARHADPSDAWRIVARLVMLRCAPCPPFVSE